MDDHIVRFIGLMGYSIPVFWLGLMGLLLFYAHLDWVADRDALICFMRISTGDAGMILWIQLYGDMDMLKNAFHHIMSRLYWHIIQRLILRVWRGLSCWGSSRNTCSSHVSDVPEWK